jgi:hypothetical protein
MLSFESGAAVVGVPFGAPRPASRDAARESPGLDISAEVLAEAVPLPSTLSTGAADRVDFGGEVVTWPVANGSLL